MSSRSAGGTVTGVCRTEWNITEETKGIIEEMEQKNGANGHSKFEVENLNLHYGNFRVYRTVRMRKIHLPENSEPYERSGGKCKD